MVKPEYSKLSDLEAKVDAVKKETRDLKDINVLVSEAERTKKL